jgi:hypothetical protein
MVTVVCAVNFVSKDYNSYTGIIPIVKINTDLKLFYRDRCVQSEVAKSYIGIILVV